MKKRLSKIARDLNSNITYVAEFLRANGYECDEDPNEEFSIEIIDFLKYNFPSFIAEKKKIFQQKEPSKPQKQIVSKESEQIPLELKIIEAASKEKKLIERIIGFTDYDWHYTVAKYKGICSQPVDFNLFDEVICDLLLTEQMSANKIGELLGLDILKDPAEREILLTALDDLRKDKMLDGDESILWLTPVGEEYAKNGVKFSTFTRDFDLYIDLIGGLKAKVKEIFVNLKSEKQFTNPDFLLSDLDEVKSLAEYQAPEIHFPKKNFLLQSADFVRAESFKAKVWVVLFENFRDNTIRAIVYDEKQNIVIDALSESLDQLEEVKNSLLEKLIKVSENEDFLVEYTDEEKQEEQVLIETELIQKHEEIELAIEAKDTAKIKEIEKQVSSIKRHFNSLEFEVELKRLFDETSNDLWIISPWIKNATFKRIPFFEKYLKKGGKIFVAYSEPEEPSQIMAYEEPLNKLLDLEKNYQNFYLQQLPAFHYKNVWLRKEDNQHLYYTGSYNILSFFVSQGLQKVRQEKMTRLDWNEEVHEEYSDVLLKFGLKYLNKAIEEFNALCQNPPTKLDRTYLQKLRTVDYGKLKPFINQGIEEFDKVFNQLEETKTENLNYYRKKFFAESIEDYRIQIIELSKQPISPERKRSIQNDFDKLRNEFMDFMEIQITNAKNIAESISNLKVFQIQQHKQNSNNYKNKNKRR